VIHVVELLPSKFEALSSNSSIENENKQTNKQTNKNPQNQKKPKLDMYWLMFVLIIVFFLN
jgi:hypothetical protein